MKLLVAVASKHGSTREIAETIAATLRAQNYTVDLRDAAEVTGLSDYDAVVFGSAIYAGNWLPDAKKFAERNRAELARRPVWLFSSGPLGEENPKPAEDPAKLATPLGDVGVRDHKIFVGKLDFGDLGFAERLIVQAVRAPEGDFRNWDEIQNWANEIAKALSVHA